MTYEELVAKRQCSDGYIQSLLEEVKRERATSDLLRVEIERIRIALGGYKDSDLVSLATVLNARNETLERVMQEIADCCNCTELCTCSDLARDKAKAVMRYTDESP
jgi:hypothetical protein